MLQGYRDDLVSMDFKLKYVKKIHANFLDGKADCSVVFLLFLMCYSNEFCTEKLSHVK